MGRVNVPAILAAAVFVATCFATVGASRGDRERGYRLCVKGCLQSDDCNGSPEPLPLPLRVFGWTCDENCRYTCAHAMSDKKEAAGRALQQYHGRWAFTRIFGMQEFASVVFSVMNGIPYLLNRNTWRDAADSHYMAFAVRAYPWVGMNCWLWSAVFHARDTWLTERLDYHCATLMVVYSLFLGLVRTVPLATARAQRRLAVVVFGAMALHIAYMNIVKFDYGWNMAVSVAAVVINFAVWLVHCWRHWRPYTWKCLLVALGTISAGLLEVLDFPPVWGRLLDAHSLWHASTVPLGFLWWGFLSDDLSWDRRVGNKLDE